MPVAGGTSSGGWQMFDAEWIAAQARHRWRIDELREDDRRARGAAALDQATDGGDECAALRHLEGRTRIQEAVLHVHDEQGSARRRALMQGVNLCLSSPRTRFLRWSHGPRMPQPHDSFGCGISLLPDSDQRF